MPLSRFCLLACLVAGLAPAFAGAAEFKMDIKSDGVRLGKTIVGTELKSDDLKGRVVMIEFWGIH
ncbi:MAG TPA: hypothetical protein VKS79_23965 [Gemmataceae bacterium]|nr:hypothetical protein [Gemmataceae bacterium]